MRLFEQLSGRELLTYVGALRRMPRDVTAARADELLTVLDLADDASTVVADYSAGMGAQVGEPERTVWAIDGDGCFQMTNQELATCAIEGIPIKVAIINNSSLGMRPAFKLK